MSINIAAAATSTTTTTTPSSSNSCFPSPTSCHQQQQQQTFEHNQIHNQAPPPIPHPSEQLCYVHCTICDTVLAVSVPSTSLFKTVTVRCGHCSNLLPVNMRAMALIHPPPPPPPLSSPHDPSHHHHHQQQQFHFPSNLSAPAGPAISTNAVTNTTTIASAPPSHSSFLDEIQNAGGVNFPQSLLTSHQINGNNFLLTTTNMQGGGGGGCNSTNITHNQEHHHHQLLIPRQVAPPPPVVNRPPEKRQRVPSAYNRFIKDEIQRIKAGNPDITHRQAFSAAAKNWAHFPHIHFGLMPGHHHHHAIRKTNICPQDGDDMIHMKDGFLASANVGVLPY